MHTDAQRNRPFEELGEIGALRGDIAAMYPKLVTTNIASMIGVAALVLGAVQFG